MTIMTREKAKQAPAHCSAEMRRLHAVADQWQRECNLDEAKAARREAYRAERYANECRKYYQPAEVPEHQS
jgi:hypothetical protein